MASTYVSLVEYLRRVATVEVTEQGIYLKDEIPDNYAGAIITMDVVYEIILVKPNGELVQQLYAPKKPLDKEGKEADGLTVDGKVVEEGDSPIKLVTIFNESLDKDLVKRVERVLEIEELIGEGQENVS